MDLFSTALPPVLLFAVLSAVRPVFFVRLLSPLKPIASNLIITSVLALALASAVIPNILVSNDLPSLTVSGFMAVAAKEALIGATYAILSSIPYELVATIGEVIDNSQGLSANGPQNPVTRDDATPLAQVATAAFTLVALHFYIDLDVFRAFLAESNLVTPVGMEELRTASAAASSSWFGAIDTLRVLLSKAVPLIAVLVSADVICAFATRHLKSGDLGGLETILKIFIGSVWLILIASHVTDPAFAPELRRAFDNIAIPALR